MEYFQDGIEWVGDGTNFSSKVIPGNWSLIIVFNI